MRRVLRSVVLLVLFFWILGLVVAVGRSETGIFEDTVLVVAVLGLVALAAPVRRITARWS